MLSLKISQSSQKTFVMGPFCILMNICERVLLEVASVILRICLYPENKFKNNYAIFRSSSPEGVL